LNPNTEQFYVEVSSSFPHLENLGAEGDNYNSSWRTIKKNIKISTKESLGYYKLKKRPRY
jgi:hypothetical protein